MGHNAKRQGEKPSGGTPESAFASVRATVDLKACLVALDTSVLLAPYETSTETLEAIRKLYALLRKEERLLIPANVAREFARNRPNVIARLWKRAKDAQSLSLGRFEPSPVLHELPAYVEAAAALRKANDALKGFRDAAHRLQREIEGWRRADPVLDTYEKIFSAETIVELSLSDAEIQAERQRRFNADIPPGNRDASKKDGGAGDLINWLTLIEASRDRQRDMVFVTGEKKADWFHQAEKEPVFPRVELLDEFRKETDGKSVDIVSLSDFLKAFGAKESIVREVERAEEDPELTTAAKQLQMSTLAAMIGERLQAVDRSVGVTMTLGSRLDMLVERSPVTYGVLIRYLSSLGDIVLALKAAMYQIECDEVLIVLIAPEAIAQQIAIEMQTSAAQKGHSVVVLAHVANGLRVLATQTRAPYLLNAFPPAYTLRF